MQSDSVTPDPDSVAHPFRIERGYRPGLAGIVTTMHANYYSQNYGFGDLFEAKVAGEMAEFICRLDNPMNEVWSVVRENNIIGSISIDGDDLGAGISHVRWFIVDDQARGTGAGKRLLSTALQFSDNNGFSEAHLWTFKGLDAARSLYEREGFTLANERPGSQWGTEVIEQQFIRHRPSSAS